jgi:DNA-binding NarL/FixJ family response regulator
MIKVVIADDHNLVRQGIRKLLEDGEDIEVIGEAEDGKIALKLVEALKPDVLVLDVMMPNMGGMEVLAKLETFANKPKVVILSMFSDLALVQEALQWGIKGYILKQSVADELLAAVRAAYRGNVYLSSGVSQAFVNGLRSNTGTPNLLDRLSPREREVVRWIVRGFTTRQIGEKLGSSVKTVEKQRRDAMRKLEVNDMASLVRVVIKLGLDPEN